MDNCFSGTVIPDPIESPCGGEFFSTDCVLTPNAITYLGLLAGASQTQINAAIITFLVGKDQQIADLQDQLNALEVRIIALENP